MTAPAPPPDRQPASRAGGGESTPTGSAPTAGGDGRRAAPATAPHARRRWRGHSRLAGTATAVVLVAGGGLVVASRGSSAETGYRTAIVGSHPVDQTFDRVGTIEPVAQASTSFPVGGTVEAVDVAVGDQVTVGQELARLETTSLDTTVADAQAALDAAELTLEKALNGEDVSGATGGGPATATPASLTTDDAGMSTLVASAAGTGTGTQAGFGGGRSGVSMMVGYIRTGAAASRADDDPELAAAQQAVLDAQEQVDNDLASAQQALDDAQAICASLTAPADPAPATDTTGSTLPPGDDDVAACQSALVAVLDAQQVAAGSQDALAEASRALDDLLAERTDAGSPSTTEPDTSPVAPGAGQPQSGSPTTGSAAAPQLPSGQASSATPGGGTGSVATSSPTSAELVAYQKAVDAAAADLAVAEQAAAQATLVSPLAGTVQAVDLAVGDTVTAGSSTAAVVIVGAGGYEVTTTVTVDDLSDVAVGQPVAVTPDGADEPTDGELVGIGTVGTSSGSATTYPVTIGLTSPPDDLRNGTTAALSIVTAETGEAVAVPTSAVTVDNGRATVTVLDGGSPAEVTVETGAVGDAWTEITDGLDVGQTVVLADLGAPLPSSATDAQTTGNFGGFGGFPNGR